MIHSEGEFRRALPANFDGVFDWDFLIRAFDYGITPMDIDAIVERRGRFLVFETKKPGQEVPKGQQITLRAMLSLPVFSVLFLDGKRQEEMQRFIYAYRNKRFEFSHESPPVVAAKLVETCSVWFQNVDKHGISMIHDEECLAIGMRRMGSEAVQAAMEEKQPDQIPEVEFAEKDTEHKPVANYQTVLQGWLDAVAEEQQRHN